MSFFAIVKCYVQRKVVNACVGENIFHRCNVFRCKEFREDDFRCVVCVRHLMHFIILCLRFSNAQLLQIVLHS
jgi:hypothetical protein